MITSQVFHWTLNLFTLSYLPFSHPIAQPQVESAGGYEVLTSKLL